MIELPVETIKELLCYDPESGTFTWRVSGRRGKPTAGVIAGCKEPRGYVQIRIMKRLYWAHRLAWAYVNGAWPVGEVDHLDGDKGNNRIANLRDGSKASNMQNLRVALRSNKSSGLLGAHWSARLQRWKASITVDGRSKHLGVFDSASEAHQAYVSAKRIYHEGCTL